MYLLGSEIEISWEIAPTSSPIGGPAYDVIETDPLGRFVYNDSVIPIEDYVAPTATTPGLITYRITPTIEGLWKVQLVTGTPGNFTVLDKTEMFVFDNQTSVSPIKHSALGISGAIEVADNQGLVSAQATKLSFLGSGFTLDAAAGHVQITLTEFPDIPYRSTNDLIAALNGALGEGAFIQDLQNRLNLIDGIGPGSVYAQVATVDNRVDSLEATVTDPISGLTALATTTSESASWVATVDGYIQAESGSILNFFTQIGDDSVQLQQHATTLNGLEAQYTVKIDNNGYVSGFGLSSTPNNGVPFSQFAIAADAFIIGTSDSDPNALDDAPFYHISLPQTIDGVLVPAGTYMKTAFIADASITNLKIGNIIQSADGGLSWSIDKEGSIFASEIIIGAGKSSYADTAAGIYLGWDATEADYVFEIGDLNSYISWDGVNLEIGGSQIIHGDMIINGTLSVDWADITNVNITQAQISTVTIDWAQITNVDILAADIINLEVDWAKITNVNVQNADIASAAVDTLELAGQAVSIPTAYFLASYDTCWPMYSTSYSRNNWYTLQSGNVVAQGNPINYFVAFNVDIGVADYQNLDLTFNLRFLVNDSVVYQADAIFEGYFDNSLTDHRDLIAFSVRATPPAGTRSWHLQFMLQSNVSNGQYYTRLGATHVSMTALEVKR